MSTQPINPNNDFSIAPGRPSNGQPSDYVKQLLQKKLLELKTQRESLSSNSDKKSSSEFIDLKIGQIQKLIGFNQPGNENPNVQQ